MLTKNYDAAETYVNATRPAIIDAVTEVLNFYGIKQKLEVYFNGEAEVARTYGSSFDDPTRSNEATDFINRGKVFVIAEVTPTEFNSGYGNSGRTETNLAVWHNKDARLTITPDFEGRLIKVDINAHIATRQDAINFRNRLQKKKDRQSARAVFDTAIHYPINHDIVFLAYRLWSLNVNAGSVKPFNPDNLPESFIKWFRESSIAPIGLITNRANNNPTFVIKRMLRENTLMFDEPTIAMTRKASAYLGKYEVSFSFSFYWQELTHWKTIYPMLVMQQSVGQEFLPKPYKDNKMRRGLNQFVEKSEGTIIRGLWRDDWLDTKRSPQYDPWFPRHNADGLEPKFIGVTVLKNVQEQIVCNIKGLKNIYWDPVIMDFMLQYHKRICRRGELILLWRLYSDDIEVDQDQIELRSNGDVVLLRPPTMANTYRIVFFIDTNLGELSEQGRRTIIDDYNYQTEIFPRVFPWWDWTRITGWTPPKDPESDQYVYPVNNQRELEDALIDAGKSRFPIRNEKHVMEMDLEVRRG